MLKKIRANLVWAIWTLVVAMLAFQGSNALRSRPSSASAPAVERKAPYPRARWRLATQTQLEASLVWLSHILIRYEGVSSEVAFSPPGWHNGLGIPGISRTEALERAEELAAELRARPDEFTSYAKRYSEDVSTRSSGGSLGGVSAYQLSFWPQLLDAVVALGPGRVSEPIETEYGFHLLLAQPPPAEQTVTGSRIVIGHDEAQWLHSVVPRGKVPSRTREQALWLAQSVYEQARRDPSAFEALLQRYSEHRDAVYSGDIGTWSTREVTPYPRQVEALRDLPVGSVAPPIESLLGFEVLLRAPNRERKEYAITTIGLLFDAAAEESSPLSRAKVFEVARALRRELDEDPTRFEELQQKHCCPGPLRWRQGEQFLELDGPLEQLELGQIAPEPIESVRQYLIPRRLDPAAVPKPQTQFGLPAPEEPDTAYLLGQMSPSVAREGLRRFAQSSVLLLGLGTTEARRFAELHEHPWDSALDLSITQHRTEVLQTFLQQRERELGPARYRQYLHLLQQRVADMVIVERAL